MLFLLLALGVGLGWMNSRWGRDYLTSRIERAVRAYVPEFSLGGVAGFLPFSFELENLQIRDRFGTQVLAVPSLRIDPQLLPLLWRRVALDELRVESPVLHVQPTRGGAWNVSEMLAAREGTSRETGQESDWSFEVDALNIQNGTIIRKQQGETTLRVEAVDLAASGTYGADGEAAATVDELSAKFGGAGSFGFSASGEASLGTREKGRDVRAELRALLHDPSRDTTAQAHLQVGGELPRVAVDLELRSPAGGSAQLSGWVLAPEADAQLAYELSLQTFGLDPYEFSAQLPRGSLDVQLAAVGRGTPLEAGSRLTLTLSLQPSELSGARIADAHATLVARGARWQLVGAHVRGLGLRVNAHAHGTDARAEGELHARVDGASGGELPGGLRARGALHISASGPLPFGEAGATAPLRVDAEADIERLAYHQLRLEDVELALHAEVREPYGDQAPVRGELTLSAKPFRVNDVTIRSLHVTARSDGARVEASARVVPKLPGAREAPPLHAQVSAPLARGERFGVEPSGLEGRLRWKSVPLRVVSELVSSREPWTGRVSAEVELQGTQRGIAVDAGVRLAHARVGDKGPFSARLKLEALPDSTSVRLTGELAGERALALQGSASWGTRQLAEADLEALLAKQIEARARVPAISLAHVLSAVGQGGGDQASARGQLAARASVDGTLSHPTFAVRAAIEDAATGGVQLGDVNLVLTGAVEKGETRGHARVTVAQELALRARASTSITPEALIRGSVPDAVPFELSAELPRYPLRALAQANPRGTQLRGVLAGTVEARGTLRDPRGTAELIGRDLAVNGVPAGDARMSVTLERDGVDAQAFLIQDDGGALRAHATARVPGSLQAKLVFDRLDVGFLPPFARIERPELDATVEISGDLARSAAGQGEQGAEGKALAATLDVEVRDAAVALPLSAGGEQSGGGRQAWKIDDVLRELAPLRVRRFAVKDSRIRLVANSEPGAPTLLLRELDLTLENVATRERLFHGAPSVLGARALFERGELVAFATLDPLAEKATFAGQVELRGLALTAVQDYLAAKLGVLATHGHFSAVAAFKVIEGDLRGSIKPVVVSPEFEAAHATLPSYLKAGIADLAELLSPDELGGRDAEAAVVPLRGKLDDPKLRPLPALFGLIQDALLAGLAKGAGSAWPWQLPVKRELLGSAALQPSMPRAQEMARAERRLGAAEGRR